MPFKVVDVLMSERDMDGVTLAQVAKQPWARGLYLRDLRRGTQELPIGRQRQARARRRADASSGPQDAVIEAAARTSAP